jgi:hypothetical protein
MLHQPELKLKIVQKDDILQLAGLYSSAGFIAELRY